MRYYAVWLGALLPLAVVSFSLGRGSVPRPAGDAILLGAIGSSASSTDCYPAAGGCAVSVGDKVNDMGLCPPLIGNNMPCGAAYRTCPGTSSNGGMNKHCVTVTYSFYNWTCNTATPSQCDGTEGVCNSGICAGPFGVFSCGTVTDCTN
ncbi:hypothetical protein VN12_08515 [Pirellula sp. SH-Sr6A]|nr:hypothetical protein VN12_08515 [Pirellula sp. SH-Sr6A]